MRRWITGALVLATLAIAAAGLLGSLRTAEAQAPKYYWEGIVFEQCLRYPVDCDVIIVPG